MSQLKDSHRICRFQTDTCHSWRILTEGTRLWKATLQKRQSLTD